MIKKEALSRVKMHELAKSVGLVDHPESQWKWALRQMRAKNYHGTKGKALMLSGDALESAKERIGRQPKEILDEIKRRSQMVSHSDEFAYTDKGRIYQGAGSRVSVPEGESALILTRNPLYDGSPDNEHRELLSWAKKISKMPFNTSDSVEMVKNMAKEPERLLSPVLSASPSGVNYNSLSPSEFRRYSRILNNMNRSFYDINDNIVSSRINDLSNELHAMDKRTSSLNDNIVGLFKKKDITSYYSPLKGKDIKADFGDNKEQAMKLIDELNGLVDYSSIRNSQISRATEGAAARLRNQNYVKPGSEMDRLRESGVSQTIMNAGYTGVHKARPRLKNGVRSVYFEGGLNG